MELNYEPLLVCDEETLGKYWPYAGPLLQKCVDKVGGDVMDLGDMYNAILSGRAFLFIAKADTVEGPDVKMAVLLEACVYPKLHSMNIVALGGNELMLMHDKFWKALCGWMYMNGARAVEGLVSPAMERIVSKFGFTKTAVHVRMQLTGE